MKIINEVKKDLSLKERIILKLFNKTFIKIYRQGMKDCFNFYNK